SEGVVTAFLEMLERDYRGALRTVFSSTNAQMSEDELRERISSQISYCPQDAAVARVRAWAADDPREAAAALRGRLRIFSSAGAVGVLVRGLRPETGRCRCRWCFSKEKRDARPASRFRMEVPCGVTLGTPQHLDVHPCLRPEAARARGPRPGSGRLSELEPRRAGNDAV